MNLQQTKNKYRHWVNANYEIECREGVYRFMDLEQLKVNEKFIAKKLMYYLNKIKEFKRREL